MSTWCVILFKTNLWIPLTTIVDPFGNNFAEKSLLPPVKV